MLSKAQKVIMYISAVLALVLGVVLIIPFRTLPGVTVDSGKVLVIVEIAVKCCLIIPMLGLSVYPCILKYRQIANKLERSKSIDVMCYFPMVVFLVGMFVFNLNTLSYSQEPLGFPLWSLIFIVFLADLMFVVVGFHLFPKLLVKLNVNMTMFLDIAIGVIAVGVIVVTAVLSSTYLKAFQNSDSYFGIGDPLLFVLYFVTLVTIIVLAQVLVKMLKKDTAKLYINFDLQREAEEKIKETEYRRAYNDILDEFEEYFEENSNNKPEDENEEELVEEEPVQEEPVQEEPVQEEPVQEETIVEEKTEPVVEKVVEEPAVVVPVETKPVAEPKPKAIKVFEPSYERVVRIASRVKGFEVNTVANSAQTSHKFYIDKKQFLLTQKTSSAYRVFFLSMPNEAFELIVQYPGVVTKPKSPKGTEWFVIQNNGSLPEDLLRSLIEKSANNLKVIEAEKKAEKERAKQAQKEAKAAEKAKAKPSSKKVA